MTDYTHWHVGMKVVCVDDSPGDLEQGKIQFVKGCVYTLAEIDHLTFSAVAVRIAEIHRVWQFSRAERFRPLVSRDTDISIFTSMLTSAKERERA